MARILVVDDEEAYRHNLDFTFSGDGHEVRAAASGREAIDVGCRFHPDVLLTDWMLKDDIHGLHVAHALRSLDPKMRAILMTGFPSSDLREEAKRCGVFTFLQKPFELATVRTAVDQAVRAELSLDGEARIGVIEVDGDDRIVSANTKARTLWADTRAGDNASRLADLIGPADLERLAMAADRWVVVHAEADHELEWHLRTQEIGHNGTRLVVIRHRSEPLQMNLAVTELLLGSTEPSPQVWPHEARVLIVDGERLIRDLEKSMLFRAKAGCYAVETQAEALNLLAGDDGIGYVVIDYHLLDGPLDLFVQQVFRQRPDICLIGTSGDDRMRAFKELGIGLYLPKPWRAEDLIRLVTQ